MASGIGHGVPRHAFVSRDGAVAGFVVTRGRGPFQREDEARPGIWAGATDARPCRVSEAVPTVAPALEASGRRLLCAFDRGTSTDVELLDLSVGRARRTRLATIAGSAQQVAWSPQGDALVLVAPPGADLPSLTSGRRIVGRAEDSVSGAGSSVHQRLLRIGGHGQVDPVSPPDRSVWEFAPAPDGSCVVVASEEAGEAGWYAADVGRIAGRGGGCDVLYRPRWQVQAPAVDPRSGAVAFVEAWASDRGLVAGEIVVVDGTGAVRRLEEVGVDVTSLAWDGRGRLWFSGWKDLGTAWGWVTPGGAQAPVVHLERASLCNSPWHPEVVAAVDGSLVVACRSWTDRAPEVALWRRGSGWRTWVASEAQAPELVCEELAWPVEDGECQGLIVQPAEGRPGDALGLVTNIHGGPSLSWHHAWNAGTNALVRAGFAVFLPNPRGGPGRGRRFAQGNHGDPGGAELRDIMAGVAALRDAGCVAGTAVMGGSYGGYLSALAAVTEDVRCAVVSAGIANLTSVRNTANNPPFYDLLIGGSPADTAVRHLYVERSAVHLANGRVAPVLILHGADDRCVPVSQAYELQHALRSREGTVEMVIYPSEGHQVLDPEHVDDYWRRLLAFLDRHATTAPCNDAYHRSLDSQRRRGANDT